MTLLRARRLLLILFPSFWNKPCACIFPTPSEPARSTRLINEVLIIFLEVYVFFSTICSSTWKTVWDRLLYEFIFVDAIFFSSLPLCSRAKMCSESLTSYLVTPSMLTCWLTLSSLIWRFFFEGSRRSLMFSL